MQPLDIFRAVWIVFAFGAVFFLFPSYLVSAGSRTTALRVAGNFARVLLIVTAGSVLLASLKIFNTTTVVCVVLVALAIGRLRKRAGSPGNWLASLQESAIGILRLIEGQSRVSTSEDVSAERRKGGLWRAGLQDREMAAVALAMVVIVTAVLYFAHPLHELRLDRPEQYETLLHGRELMLNLAAHERPVVFPSVIATIAFLSSADPMQVTRFLTPVLELLLVVGVGFVIRTCTGGVIAAIASMYCFGAAALQAARTEGVVPLGALEKLEDVLRVSSSRTRGSPEFEIGLLCLLLALALLADWQRNSGGWDSLVDAGCCLLLVGAVSQNLLLLCVIAAVAVLFRPVMGVVVVVLLTYALAAYAVLSSNLGVPREVQLILPLAAALGLGGLLGLIETKLVTPMGKAGDDVLLSACAMAAIFWCHPHAVADQYLEYENAAAETQVIAETFPRQTWVVVAPTEQLAETLGLGGYEDLAQFVEKYQSEAAEPEFRIQDAPEDLFIYVEKKPFQFFSREPDIVTAVVLADTTYRNYRSPAGRASLESAALQLCESYRQSHSGTEIFFEDQVLRIYHLRRQAAPKPV